MGNQSCTSAAASDKNKTAPATNTTTIKEESAKEKEAPVAESKYQKKAKQNLAEWFKVDIKTSSPRSVTRDELAKHVTADDCWTILHGKVYDITPYLAYHPGGKRELMKGAGKDCTTLFNKFHAYVQYESILAKCVIGVLVEGGSESLVEGDEDSEEED